MFRISSAALCVALALVVAQGADVSVDHKFKRNLRENEDGSITRHVRDVKLRKWDGAFGAGVTFSSMEKSVTKDENGKQKSVDRIYGAVEFRNRHIPSVWLSRFQKDKTVDLDVDGNISAIVDVDVRASGGFAAAAFYSLKELDPANNTVSEIIFQPGVGGAMRYDLGAVGTKNGVHAVTIKGTPTNAANDLRIAFTFLVSNEPFVLDVNGLEVSSGPNKFKGVFGFRDWSLANAANHLRLTMGVALGGYKGRRGFNASRTLDSEDGMSFDAQAYAAYGTTAGNSRIGAVSLSGFESEVELDVAIQNKLPFKDAFKGKYQARPMFRKIWIDFEAGQESGVYDPAVYATAEVSAESPSPSSAAAAGPVLASMALLLSASLLH